MTDLRTLAERAAIGVLPADYPLENLAKGSEVFSLQQQLADEIERVALEYANQMVAIEQSTCMLLRGEHIRRVYIEEALPEHIKKARGNKR